MNMASDLNKQISFYKRFCILLLFLLMLFIAVVSYSIFQLSLAHQEQLLFDEKIAQLQSQNDSIQMDLTALIAQNNQYQALLREARTALENTSTELSHYSGLVVYTTSTGTRYHYSDCSHLQGILPTIRLKSDAISQGYLPCLDCNAPNGPIGNPDLLARLEKMRNS